MPRRYHPAIPDANAAVMIYYAPEGRNEGPSSFDTFEAASMFDKLSGITPEDAIEPSQDDSKGADEHQEAQTTPTEEDAQLDELEAELRGPDDKTDPSAAKADVSLDDTDVEIVVDGNKVTAKVKDLKRLYGQEASLTRKSMEAAEIRKTAEERVARADAVLKSALAKAEERWSEYEKLDFHVLSARVAKGDMSIEDFQAIRQDALRAFQDVEFLKAEGAGFMEAQKAEREKTLREQAQATITELSDPEKGIPGWGQELYNDIRKYGVSIGIPASEVDTIVSAPAIRTLHKAMLYDRLKDKAQQRLKSNTPTAPKRPMKSDVAAPSSDDPNLDRRSALEKLRRAGGKIDAAAAAFDTI